MSNARKLANLIGRLRVTSTGVLSVEEEVITEVGTLSDASGDVRSIPQIVKTAGYTISAADNGKHIAITDGSITIPPDVFTAGQAVTIFNNATTSRPINKGIGVTVYNAGDGTDGSRALGARGLATVLCVASNTFAITGAGLS